MSRTRKEEDEYQLGVKAGNLKERSVERCLNCTKPICTTCPITEKENKHETNNCVFTGRPVRVAYDRVLGSGKGGRR